MPRARKAAAKSNQTEPETAGAPTPPEKKTAKSVRRPEPAATASAAKADPIPLHSIFDEGVARSDGSSPKPSGRVLPPPPARKASRKGAQSLLNRLGLKPSSLIWVGVTALTWLSLVVSSRRRR